MLLKFLCLARVDLTIPRFFDTFANTIAPEIFSGDSRCIVLEDLTSLRFYNEMS